MKNVVVTSPERFATTRTEECKAYIKALCRLASAYVARIRVKFAERAYEKYADPTIRRLVLEYGKECEKLDEDRLRDFEFASEYGATTEESLNDSCLINAREYGRAIWFLFDIDDDKEGKE